ncbi:hypothetical protein HN695_07440 [Candidatus Woesearchaeota archaeon]|jgi:hypothetical protein|nr:hypothetical protein [Candidatus Woesearchaeota archaeon]MBT5272669.1 hypothetical protein [Candidatus Woesearchaeota archaeon]MBT6041694.1 hypothetical protein [Candidatus Woesearchaeota archaeon]MBT6337221.1 hypothetical protein [Candidatus Woesearchaeota archaeon]MBT7928141.1 hypothetical protein [Candidatus Woesearchaeota archaeon]
MADPTLLTTFYSFTLAIIIFLATKFLDHNEKIREFLASNFDKWEKDKETYENLKDGIYGQIWMMIPILFAIFLNLYLLVDTVFENWKSIGWKNYVLIIFIFISILLIFAQPIINNIVTVHAGYEGNPEKYMNFGKKKR